MMSKGLISIKLGIVPDHEGLIKSKKRAPLIKGEPHRARLHMLSACRIRFSHMTLH